MHTHLIDMLDRNVSLHRTPQRIVSLVPSQTELLTDLGLVPQLVGITKFCIHPDWLRNRITVVGGTKKVNYDKIERLKPDVVIANKEENTPGMITTIEKIAPVYVSDIASFDDSLHFIKDVGDMCARTQEAARMISHLKTAREKFTSHVERKSWRTTAYLIWKDPWMAAGTGTYINDMLRINRLQNVFTEQRYPEVTVDVLVAANPQVVILSSEPYPFKASDAALISKLLPQAKVICADGEMFSWYGSRSLQAFKYFQEIQRSL